MQRKVGLPAFRIAVVALAYFLAGGFSNPLEVPSGYPTVVWPPAGIALQTARERPRPPGVGEQPFGGDRTSRRHGLSPTIPLAVERTRESGSGISAPSSARP